MALVLKMEKVEQRDTFLKLRTVFKNCGGKMMNGLRGVVRNNDSP
jgi:hypothetical protein